MQRTIITLPRDLLERLRQVADEREMSVEAVVREALEEKMSEHPPRPRSLGVGASDFTNTARQTADERPVPRSWR